MKLYLPLGQLSGGHTDSINSAAFSVDGKFLATGSEDGGLVIWSVEKGSIVERRLLNSSILTVMWDLHVPKRLYFGCMDGTAAYLNEPHGPIHHIKTGLYDVPVYAFAVGQGTSNIALAAGTEVHIAAQVNVKKSYATLTILPKPRSFSEPKSESAESVNVIGRSLHFLDGSSKLLVSYLNHGIVCWDIENLVQLWQIEPGHSHHYIGSSDVSADEAYIGISNLSTGIDVYSLTSLELVHSFPAFVDPNTNFPVSVQFLQSGKLLTCGSHNGGVCIWEKESGRVFQTLRHEVKLVTSVAVHSKTDVELVATATTGAQPRIYLWKTELPRKSILADVVSSSVVKMNEIMPLNKFCPRVSLLIVLGAFLLFATHSAFSVHRTMTIYYFSESLDNLWFSTKHYTLWTIAILKSTTASNLEALRKVLWEWLQPPVLSFTGPFKPRGSVTGSGAGMQSSYQGLPQNTYPQTNDSDSESSVYYSGEDVSFANTSYLPSNSLNAAPMEGVENDELEMNLEAYYQVAAATSQSRLSETALQSHGISLLPQQPPQDPAYLASQIRLSHTPLQVNGIPPYPQPQPPRDPAYLASQSYLSSQTALQLQLHATTGEYHVQRQSIVDTRGVESSLGWIDITNSESMSTPMPRQLPLPLSTSSASSASSVTSTIIHASSDFCQPETQSEKMDEDYNELGSPRHVTRLPSRHVKKNVSSKRKGSERSGVNSDPRSLPITNPSTPNLKEKPHSDEPLPIVIRPTGADTIHPTTSKPSVENPQRPFDPPVDYIKLLMDTIGNMHIAHHETRDLLHVLDKRQQDMSATLQTALSSSGDSGRTEVAPRASRQQGKSKLKKRRGKLEKISQAMTDPQWSYFKDCIRKHLKRLLKVNRLDESLLKFAPLTPEEQEVYQNKDIRRLVPDLVITPENFRLDMTLPRTSAFNTEAQDVFVEDFMQKVKEQKWYAEEDIPESFLDYEIIYFAIHEHLHHVFAMYREACQEDGKELKENRQARSAKNTRKRTLFEERFSLVKKDSALAHHCHLLDIIGVQGMSSDESDYGGSQVVYNRILPGWRSQELQDFLWRLDDIRDEVAKRPVGKRRHGLQRGRQRLRTNLKINEESVAPPNLPCNCYRPRWLKGLRPYQLKQLEIVKDNYDFSAA